MEILHVLRSRDWLWIMNRYTEVIPTTPYFIKKGNPLYDLIIAICKDNTWKKVGSSAPKRHQVCTQGKQIPEWKNIGPPALKVLDKFNRENRNRHCISDKHFEKL